MAGRWCYHVYQVNIIRFATARKTSCQHSLIQQKRHFSDARDEIMHQRWGPILAPHKLIKGESFNCSEWKISKIAAGFEKKEYLWYTVSTEEHKKSYAESNGKHSWSTVLLSMRSSPARLESNFAISHFKAMDIHVCIWSVSHSWGVV